MDEMKTIDIKQLSDVELEAYSYRQIKEIERLRNGLQVLETEMANRAKAKVAMPEVTPEANEVKNGDDQPQ